MSEDNRDQFHAAMWAGQKGIDTCKEKTGGKHEFEYLGTTNNSCLYCLYRPLTKHEKRDWSGLTSKLNVIFKEKGLIGEKHG